MVEHLRRKIKLGHGLPDPPTEGACLCGKDNKGFNQYVMKARNPCATSHSQQKMFFYQTRTIAELERLLLGQCYLHC